LAKANPRALYNQPFISLILASATASSLTMPASKFQVWARSEIQDSISYIADDFPVGIKQLYFDNEIGEPTLARIRYRACSVA
jgi:hypothetical protein